MFATRKEGSIWEKLMEIMGKNGKMLSHGTLMDFMGSDQKMVANHANITVKSKYG